MAAPKTRNWSALESAHKPKGLHLLVRGEVEVSTLSKLPQLTKRTSRDPKVRQCWLGVNHQFWPELFKTGISTSRPSFPE